MSTLCKPDTGMRKSQGTVEAGLLGVRCASVQAIPVCTQLNLHACKCQLCLPESVKVLTERGNIISPQGNTAFEVQF